jgi:nitrogen regulatory protein P-II 1
MNKVEAIIRPEKLNDVKEALVAVGLIGLNVVNVTGRGAQRGVTAGGSRGVGRYEIDMLPKVKLELVVHDDATQKAVDTIVEHARTGNIGDGKIFIAMPSRLGRAKRVKTLCNAFAMGRFFRPLRVCLSGVWESLAADKAECSGGAADARLTPKTSCCGAEA